MKTKLIRMSFTTYRKLRRQYYNRKNETIAEWLDRILEENLVGWRIK